MSDEEIEVNDVIQIGPVFVREGFRGKVAVVYEVKNWGVCASILSPEGEYPIKLSHDEYKRVGKLNWLLFTRDGTEERIFN